MIDAEFRIPFDALDGLKGRIAEANKKAARLDVEPLTLTIGETDTVEKFVGGFPTGEVLVFVNGTITGTTPRLNGWAFRFSEWPTPEPERFRLRDWPLTRG